MAIQQHVEAPGITCIAKYIAKLSFEAPEGPSAGAQRGKINVTNNLVKLDETDSDGRPSFRLSVSVSVSPEEGCEYFKASVKVIGIFRDDAGMEDAESAVLSVGAASLYPYACEAIESLTRGGAIPGLILPILSFTTSDVPVE